MRPLSSRRRLASGAAPFLASLVLGVLASPPARAEEPPAPNVVVITLDTTRADRLAAFGNPARLTPNLDALAAGGTVFRQARTPIPVTLPAHVSIFSGWQPARHGVRHNGFYRVGPEVPLLAEDFARRGYRTGAAVGAFVVDGRFGLTRGFSMYMDQFPDRKVREIRAPEVTRRALEWLGSDRTPFFLWVHYFDPHDPYEAPISLVPGSTPYDAEVAFMDAAIGDLLAGVRKAAGDRPTVVVAVGDHGEMLGEHGEERHGVLLYEPAVHVPMIWNGPGIPAGLACDEPVSLVDVAPTLRALAGAPPRPADGISLVPAFSRQPLARPDPLLPLETWLPWFEYGWIPLFGTVDGNLKMIRGGARELYDLASDRNENRNLVATRPKDAARLGAAVDARVAADPLWSGGFGGGRSPDLSDEEIRSLQSLGYLQGAAARPATRRPSGATLDPRQGLPLLKAVEEASREFRDGKVSAAKTRILHVLKQNPDNPWVLGRAGHMLFEAGLYGDAAVFFRKAIDIYPGAEAVDWCWLARALGQAGRTSSALAAVDRALELDPELDEALGIKAQLLFEAGRREELRAFLAARFHSDTTNVPLLFHAGAQAMADGDLPRARGLFHRLLGQQPGNTAALAQLAAIAVEEKNLPLAASYLERALQVEPESFRFVVQLAAVEEASGNGSRARELYRRALTRAPDDVERQRLRAILARLGD